MTAPQFYTVVELAALLHVSQRTIRRWSEAGKIPAPIAPGGPHGVQRWHVADVQARLEALRAQAVHP